MPVKVGAEGERQSSDRHAEQPDNGSGIVQRARADMRVLVQIMMPELLKSLAVALPWRSPRT
jgi:hypothetical protein